MPFDRLGPDVQGQLLRLPTLDYFSVQTSVLVPDRGGTYLGGVRRSTYGTSSYGVPGVGGAVGTRRLLGSRGLSAGTRAGGASVHATVIDHEALDRAVLAEAARRRGERLAVERSAADLSRRLGEGTSSSSSPSTALMSVAEIRRQNAQRRASQQREAQRLFAQGAEAQSKGSLGAARIFYQMAHRRADAELKQRLAARLSQLGASVKSRATSR